MPTSGFQLSDLPRLSGPFPANTGRYSTQEANQTEDSSYEMGRKLVNSIAQYKADQALLANQKAQADAAASTAAPKAKADIATSNVLAQQNNPDVAALKGLSATTGAKNVLSQENLDAQELELLKTLTPQQYAAYKQVKGFGKVSSNTATRDPVTGALSETAASGIAVPGAEPVVTDKAVSTGPAPFALAGGYGTLVGDGKGGQTVVHTPPAILSNVTGTEPQFMGTTVRPDGVAEDEYVINEYNQMGGIRPGKSIKQAHGLPAPEPTGSRAFTQPKASVSGPQVGGPQAPAPTSSAVAAPTQSNDDILKAATAQAVGGKMNAELVAKTKMDALNDISASAESTTAMLSNIDKADKAIQDYNTGISLPNAVRGHMNFLPSVQAVEAAKSQFVSDIMGKLRGAGRVTQQEVQYASDAYPTPLQAEAVQKQNIQYLRDTSNTIANRRAYEYNAIKDGMLPADAKMAAIQKFPIPPPANYTPTPGPSTVVVTAQTAKPAATPASTPTPAHPEDAAAVQWAQANPSDPRSAAILKANGL